MDYSLSGPKTWNISGIDIQIFGDLEDGPLLQISIGMRDRGQSDLKLVLSISAINATLSANSTGPFAGSLTSYPKVTGNSPNWGYVNFLVQPNDSATSFIIQIDSAGKIQDYTFPDVLPNFFSEVAPYGPTHLKYVATPHAQNQYLLGQEW